MSNLIITIISIALVAVTAMMAIFYMSQSYGDHEASANTSRIINDIRQIDATIIMMNLAGQNWPMNTNVASTVFAQMNSAPSPPQNIMQAPNNLQNYEVYFYASPKVYVIQYWIGTFSGYDYNGRAWDGTFSSMATANVKNLGAKICKAAIATSRQINPYTGQSVNTSLALGSGMSASGAYGISCWFDGVGNKFYIAMANVY